MPRMTVKTRKPADATLRNVRASNNRDAALGKRVDRLERWVAEILAIVRGPKRKAKTR